MSHEKERSFEMEIDFRQDPDTIWRSLTEAEELVRWFPTLAKVEPRPGGRVLFSWEEEGFEFDTRIQIWEPGKRLRLVQTKSTKESPTELAMDFQIRGEKGVTTLRLVHSGFGRGADWDDELAGISRGWTYELRILRHYLDHFPGQNRHMNMLFHASALDARTAYERVFGPRGLSLEAGGFALAEGETFHITAGADETYQGKVFVSNPPLDWAGTVISPEPGMLRYHLEGNTVILSLSTWGGNGKRVAHFARKWRKKLADIL